MLLSNGHQLTWHIQLTCHFEGDTASLNPIIKELFGVTVDDIKNAFK